jgi:hypothetical protein
MGTKMRKWVLSIAVVLVLFIAGCGSESLLIGGGMAAGGALSNTLAGAEKDLEAREIALIELYNQGVADGAAVETLEGLKQQIRDTQLTRESVETGKGLLDVDWTDSKDVGGAVGGLAALALLWYNRKQKAQIAGRDEAISKFEGISEPAVASQLHEIVKAKTNGTG